MVTPWSQIWLNLLRQQQGVVWKTWGYQQKSRFMHIYLRGCSRLTGRYLSRCQKSVQSNFENPQKRFWLENEWNKENNKVREDNGPERRNKPLLKIKKVCSLYSKNRWETANVEKPKVRTLKCRHHQLVITVYTTSCTLTTNPTETNVTSKKVMRSHKGQTQLVIFFFTLLTLAVAVARSWQGALRWHFTIDSLRANQMPFVTVLTFLMVDRVRS